MIQLTMIGSGNLTKTFVLGWIPHLDRLHMNLSVLARSEKYRQRGWETIPIAPGLNPEILKTANVIIVSVKPKDMGSALQAVRTYASPESLVVSVLAGISLSTLTEELPGRAIIRTMPNVAVAVGQGTIVVAESAGLEHALWPWLKQALDFLGHIVITDEALVDPATALSGSGPAYVYLLLQAISDAGQAMGIPAELARNLAIRTVRGAAEVALDNPEASFDDLISWVASPGGTTQAALDRLKELQVSQSLREAVLQAGAKAAGMSMQTNRVRQNFARIANDCIDEVAARDLHIHAGIAEESVDPFNGMFGRGGPSHR